MVRSQGHYWSNAHLRDHRSGCLLKRFLEAKDLIMLAAVVAEGWREWSRIWTEASVSRSPDKGYAISGNEIETCQTVKHSSARIATKLWKLSTPQAGHLGHISYRILTVCTRLVESAIFCAILSILQNVGFRVSFIVFIEFFKRTKWHSKSWINGTS